MSSPERAHLGIDIDNPNGEDFVSPSGMEYIARQLFYNCPYFPLSDLSVTTDTYPNRTAMCTIYDPTIKNNDFMLSCGEGYEDIGRDIGKALEDVEFVRAHTIQEGAEIAHKNLTAKGIDFSRCSAVRQYIYHTAEIWIREEPATVLTVEDIKLDLWIDRYGTYVENTIVVFPPEAIQIRTSPEYPFKVTGHGPNGAFCMSFNQQPSTREKVIGDEITVTTVYDFTINPELIARIQLPAS